MTRLIIRDEAVTRVLHRLQVPEAFELISQAKCDELYGNEFNYTGYIYDFSLQVHLTRQAIGGQEHVERHRERGQPGDARNITGPKIQSGAGTAIKTAAGENASSADRKALRIYRARLNTAAGEDAES